MAWYDCETGKRKIWNSVEDFMKSFPLIYDVENGILYAAYEASDGNLIKTKMLYEWKPTEAVSEINQD